MNRPKKQRGIALIVVMLVVALVVIIAANMTGRLQLLMSRSVNQQMAQQGIWSALSGEKLVYKVLEQDFKDNPSSVHLQQLWAREGMVFPLGNGMLEGEVQDLHSCFNLNALAAPRNNNAQNNGQPSLIERQFQALLITIGVEGYNAEQLTSTIKDWVDSDTLMTGSLGAEDETYSGKIVPYLAPNNLMVNISELMAVEGISAELYRTIRPYVCLVPSIELRLNANTIKPEHGALLVAVFEPNLSLSDAKSLLSARNDEGFNDIADFFALSEITAIGKIDDDVKKQLQITSNDFRARLTYRAQQQEFSVESIFQRDENQKLSIISRQFGRTE